MLGYSQKTWPLRKNSKQVTRGNQANHWMFKEHILEPETVSVLKFLAEKKSIGKQSSSGPLTGRRAMSLHCRAPEGVSSGTSDS